jgi:hypothetical protein
MIIAKLKDIKVWGWIVSVFVAVAELFLLYTHVSNQSSVLGIINIQSKASYIYEGSYYWLGLVPVSTVLFYWAFTRFIYVRITNFKKVKPYTVLVAMVFMLMSLGLTTLMVFRS